MKLSKQDLIRLVEASQKFNQYFTDCLDIRLEFAGRFNDLGCLDFLEVLFDIMSLPADNTVETNCLDIVNKTGDWPEWAFCRDWWDDLINTMTPEEIVNEVLEYVSTITSEEKEAYESAHLNHPASKD